MSTYKRGVPAGFKLDIDKPIKLGDYAEEVLGIGDGSPTVETIEAPFAPPKSKTLRRKRAKIDVGEVVTPPVSEAVVAVDAVESELHGTKRARLNVSMPSQKKLSVLVARMRKSGPEPTLNASEVLEALIMAAYDAQEHIDLGNVRRRGKYGSPSHKNFPVALAESLTNAMKEAN